MHRDYLRMTEEDIARRLKTVAGVHDAIAPPRDVLAEAFSMEAGIGDTTFGMPLENRALEECIRRDACVCVLCDHSFEKPTDHVMTMEDCNGRMVAYDIPAGRKGDYAEKKNLIWISDDFVMEADGEAVKMVMLPQRTRCICEADGVRDAVIFYPATTTDAYLRKQLGYMNNDSRLATALVAFFWT